LSSDEAIKPTLHIIDGRDYISEREARAERNGNAKDQSAEDLSIGLSQQCKDGAATV
jgi:hypothetical protein